MLHHKVYRKSTTLYLIIIITTKTRSNQFFMGPFSDFSKRSGVKRKRANACMNHGQPRLPTASHPQYSNRLLIGNNKSPWKAETFAFIFEFTMHLSLTSLADRPGSSSLRYFLKGRLSSRPPRLDLRKFLLLTIQKHIQDDIYVHCIRKKVVTVVCNVPDKISATYNAFFT